MTTAAIIAFPALILAFSLRLAGRRVEWVPLLWAGFACLVYFLLLRSRAVLPLPDWLQEPGPNWFGKLASVTGTMAMLRLLPRTSYRSGGLTWAQNKGSLRPVILVGGLTLASAVASSFFFAPSPNTGLENLLFQASLPGLDEELCFRGLLLILLHQAFGRDMRVWGAESGWGLWLVVAIFGLLHGVTVEGGHLQVNFAAVMFTGFIGFVLTWMRERTGSLVVPVLFHNAFNVVLVFV